MKLELVAESEDMQIHKFVETEIIGAVIDREEKKGKICHGNIVIEEYNDIETAEDLEKKVNEKLFDLAVKTAVVIYMAHNKKTE